MYVRPRSFLGLAIVLVASIAGAHSSPPGCFVNNLGTDISIPPILAQVRCGQTVPFTTAVGNGTTAGACDVTDVPVTFTCPDPATGSPTGPSTVLATADDFTAVPPSSKTYPAVSCTIGDTSSGTCVCGGGGVYQAQVHAGPGVLHLNAADVDFADVVKTLSVQCTTDVVPRAFQCFETKPEFAPRNAVTLIDSFGTTNATVGQPQRLCNPADPNRQDPIAVADPNHLVGYEMQNANSVLPVRNITIVNQFGTVRLDATRLVRLLVPTLKSHTSTPPPLVDPPIDHFTCYAVERSRGEPKFTPIPNVLVEDQFGPKTVDIMEPAQLCLPADKNGEDPGAQNHPGHLLCYNLKHARDNFGKLEVFTNDQFGPRDLRIIRREELCIPSVRQ